MVTAKADLHPPREQDCHRLNHFAECLHTYAKPCHTPRTPHGTRWNKRVKKGQGSSSPWPSFFVARFPARLRWTPVLGVRGPLWATSPAAVLVRLADGKSCHKNILRTDRALFPSGNSPLLCALLEALRGVRAIHFGQSGTWGQSNFCGNHRSGEDPGSE
ncbi:MAG: hypothetical protein JWQ35_2030 [Bacteriovoracaceae bacterium]|nr:hypothetical protein [Bacteriovoracaceae bacterium]